MAAVERLLEKLNLSEIPVIRVFNKQDLVDPVTVDNICASYDGIGISAINSKTFPPLVKRMEDEILRSLSIPTDATLDRREVPRPGVL
jgi:GTP-binding protein HflX